MTPSSLGLPNYLEVGLRIEIESRYPLPWASYSEDITERLQLQVLVEFCHLRQFGWSRNTPTDWPSLLWKSSKYGDWERRDILNTLTFSIPRGGQSGTLTFFWNQLLTGQHLANSGEAQLKNHPYMFFYIDDLPITWKKCRYIGYRYFFWIISPTPKYSSFESFILYTPKGIACHTYFQRYACDCSNGLGAILVHCVRRQNFAGKLHLF